MQRAVTNLLNKAHLRRNVLFTKSKRAYDDPNISLNIAYLDYTCLL